MTEQDKPAIPEWLPEYLAVLKREEAELAKKATERWNEACSKPDGEEKDRLFEEYNEAMVGELVRRQVREDLIRDIIDGDGQRR